MSNLPAARLEQLRRILTTPPQHSDFPLLTSWSRMASLAEKWRREDRAEAWDEAVQALAWCLDNGPADSALPHVAEHNPYRSDLDTPDPEDTP